MTEKEKSDERYELYEKLLLAHCTYYLTRILKMRKKLDEKLDRINENVPLTQELMDQWFDEISEIDDNEDDPTIDVIRGS